MAHAGGLFAEAEVIGMVGIVEHVFVGLGLAVDQDFVVADPLDRTTTLAVRITIVVTH